MLTADLDVVAYLTNDNAKIKWFASVTEQHHPGKRFNYEITNRNA